MAKYLKLYNDGCNGTRVGGLYEIDDPSEALEGWYERSRGVFESDDGALLVKVPDEAEPWKPQDDD